MNKSEKGKNRSVGLAFARVTRADGTEELHVSVPRVPLTNRSARKKIRKAINAHANGFTGKIVIHRATKNGVTNKLGGLAWL